MRDDETTWLDRLSTAAAWLAAILFGMLVWHLVCHMV